MGRPQSFRAEGGLPAPTPTPTGLQRRRFVSQDCPIFKIGRRVQAYCYGKPWIQSVGVFDRGQSRRHRQSIEALRAIFRHELAARQADSCVVRPGFHLSAMRANQALVSSEGWPLYFFHGNCANPVT